MIAPVWKAEADVGPQSPCRQQPYQHCDDFGMRLAGNVDDFDLAVARFTVDRREASRVSQAHLCTRLNGADGRVLSDWLEQAEARGIDAAIDLSVRPWNIAGIRIIVGIFERDRSEASWLIVGCPAGWLLAGCASGFVSDVSAALCDILALISDDVRA
jgi:hypothetical protein